MIFFINIKIPSPINHFNWWYTIVILAYQDKQLKINQETIQDISEHNPNVLVYGVFCIHNTAEEITLI